MNALKARTSVDVKVQRNHEIREIKACTLPRRERDQTRGLLMVGSSVKACTWPELLKAATSGMFWICRRYYFQRKCSIGSSFWSAHQLLVLISSMRAESCKNLVDTSQNHKQHTFLSYLHICSGLTTCIANRDENVNWASPKIVYTWRLQANFNQKQQNHASKKIEKHEFNLRSAERCWLGALAAWHLWWHDRHTTQVIRAHTGRPRSVCAPCLISFDYQQKQTETAGLGNSASCVFRCTVWNRKGSSFLDNKTRHVLVAVGKRKWYTLL